MNLNGRLKFHGPSTSYKHFSGNTGLLAYTLCQYYPNMKITVYDVQSVVDCASHFKPSLEDCPHQDNVTFDVVDFFQPDLPKADLYVLSRIIHDWPAEKVDVMLSNIFNCIPSGNGYKLH